MLKSTWYTNALAKYRKETVKSAIVFITFIVSLTIVNLITGKEFVWQEIEPISEPSILHRLFYSALVYVTIGSVLYNSGFYKSLYSLYRSTKKGWKEYNKMKSAIWGLLLLLMFFVIVPFVVGLLNNTLSFLFNMFKLFLYIFPSVMLTGTVLILWHFYRKKMNVL